MKKLILLSILFLGFLALVRPVLVLAGAPNMSVNNFYVASDSQQDWSTNLPQTSLGEEVYFYLEIQNLGPESVAENTLFKILVPDYLSSDLSVKSWVGATTGTSGKQSDSKTVNVHLNNPSWRLTPRWDSVRITGDMNNDGTKEYNNFQWPNPNAFTSMVGANLGSLTAGPNAIQIFASAYVTNPLQPNLSVIHKVKNLTKGGDFAAAVNASAGDELQYYLEIHNLNTPSTAQNINVKVNLGQGNLTQSQSIATISSSNASSTSGTATVNISPQANLSFTNGSTVLYWDWNGDGTWDYYNTAWGSNDLVGNGINLTQPLYGCYSYILQIYFKVKVNAIPSVTPTPTPTPTPTLTLTPTGTPTPIPTLPVRVTPTITPTPTPTPASSPTATPTPTPAILPKTATPIEGMLSLLTIGLGASVLGFGLKRLVGGYLKEMENT